MDEAGSNIVFKYIGDELQSYPELNFDDIKIMMKQDAEIRRFMEIVKRATPTFKPILYSRV